MIQDGPLSPEQKKKSQRNYNMFSLINGLSYMSLGEAVIILYAVRLDAPNTIIAVIGAMIFIGFVLLPLGIRQTARYGAAKSQADFWVARNIAALLVALSGAVYLFSKPLSWCVLLLGAFLFYGFRAAGVVMSQPLMGDISSENDRGQLIARSTGLFYFSGMLAMLLISMILRFYDSMLMLAGIIVFGAVCGVTASTYIRNIDETSSIMESARRPLFQELGSVIHLSNIRHLVPANFVVNVAIIMTAPMSIAAIKRGYAVSDTNALVFSLLQFGASIFGTWVGGKLSGTVGPRKTAIFAYLATMPVCLIWIFAPSPSSPHGIFYWAVLMLPFIIQGITTVCMANAMMHYFLMSVPKEKQVATSLLVNLASAVGAGLTGMLLASGIVKFAEYLCDGSSQDNIYRLYFMGALAILLAGLGCITRLDTVITTFRAKHGTDAVKQTIKTVHIRG